MQPDGQHSLRELAAELHRSKRTLQLWAQELPDGMKQQSSGGAIMVTDAGAELLRQRAAKRPAQSAKQTAQSDCAPREISQDIARETAKNPRNDTENRENFALNRENNREIVPDSREIAREISHPIAQPDSSTDALALALDALQQTIDRQAAELLRVREELADAETRAADADKCAAVFSEKLDGLQRSFDAEQERTAQQAAEIAAQRQTIDRLTEQLAAAQAAQADTAAQLAAIADKQADALRAGAAEQLALAIPEQPEPEPERRGFLARLSHWVKAAAPQLGRTRTPENAFTKLSHAATTAGAADEKEKARRADEARRDPERRRENSCTLFHDYYIMKGRALSMYTQEQMCVMIQTGSRQDLIPHLWDRVQKLYTQKAFRYYSSHRERCKECGVEVEDIQQTAYFAFLESIEAYKPESGLLFSSYINYPFMRQMQELLGYRLAAGRNDALNGSGSLDKEIENDDGGGSTLHDIVPDVHSLEFIEQLDADSVAEMVRAEVRKLPDRLCFVIEKSYFDGLTLGEIGEQLHITHTRAAQLRQQALRQLAKSRNLAELHSAFYHTNKLRRLESQSRHSFDAEKQYEELAERIQQHRAESAAMLLWLSGASVQSSTE